MCLQRLVQKKKGLQQRKYLFRICSYYLLLLFKLDLNFNLFNIRNVNYLNPLEWFGSYRKWHHIPPVISNIVWNNFRKPHHPEYEMWMDNIINTMFALCHLVDRRDEAWTTNLIISPEWRVPPLYTCVTTINKTAILVAIKNCMLTMASIPNSCLI